MPFTKPSFPWRQFPPDLDVTNIGQLTEWINSASDPRVADWFLMSSFLPTLALSVLYVALVIIGMRVMKNRKPYDLRELMLGYNAVVIVLNAYMFGGFVNEIFAHGYSWICHPIDWSPTGFHALHYIHVYYLSKLLDFTDTAFMVLRCKFDQVTFLHVYHHALMFPIWWFAVKFAGGGSAGVAGPTLNSFVHIVMYTYYLAATFKVSIPGKRYLTQMQLLQLLTAGAHSALTVWYDCDYPHWTMWAQMFYMATLFALFLNFYYRAYALRERTPGGAAAKKLRPKAE